MINNSKSAEKYIKENTNQLRLKLQNKIKGKARKTQVEKIRSEHHECRPRADIRLHIWQGKPSHLTNNSLD